VSEEGRSYIRLGTLVYLLNGDIYLRELPGRPARQLTEDGKNASPRWSPNGQWVSFFANGQLCAVRRDGTKRRTYPCLSGWQQTYDWLPRSSSLLLVKDRGKAIVRVEVTTGSSRAVIGSPAEYEDLAGVSVSPDGKRFAYTTWQRATEANPRRPSVGRLWTASIDGRNRRKVFTSLENERVPLVFGWSPDSRYVLFWALIHYPAASVNADGIHFYSAAIDGSRCREISNTTAVDWVLEKREQIAVRQTSPCLAIGAGGSRFSVENKWIVLHDPVTGKSRRLTGDRFAASHPSWSRDGKRIAFIACPIHPKARYLVGEAYSNLHNRLRLHVMDANGRNMRRLTEGETYDDSSPRYLADDRHILFERLHRDSRQYSLWIVREDGRNLREVVPAIGNTEGGPFSSTLYDVAL
jgi:Tol biopolymer transport system component